MFRLRQPASVETERANQETTLDGERYRHVLCRTGHSSADDLVEDSGFAEDGFPGSFRLQVHSYSWVKDKELS